MRVNEHIDAIALARGEPDEARRIELDLSNVLRAMRLLVTGTTNLTWVTAGYGWFTLVAPILVAAPLYFAGSLSFGGLMMASGAFMQVQSSLRWFVDNFSTIADWRATLLRVASFRRAVIDCDVLHDVASRIEFTEGEPGRLTLDDLEIASPAGTAMLAESHVEMKAGERVLVVGETGTGKTLLFRALAGLWPWGSGPGRASAGRVDPLHAAYVVFSAGHAARSARLPLGRSSASRPRRARGRSSGWVSSGWRPARRVAALGGRAERGGAAQPGIRARVASCTRLADHRRGARGAGGGRPAAGSEILAKDLEHAGVLYIGRTGAQDPLFGRVIHLVNDPEGRRLPPRSRPRAVTAGSLG